MHEFTHSRSRLVVATGAANHRGRDALFVVGEPQTLEAKFAYGPIDKDLKDEDVLFEVARDGRFEALAIVRTSVDDENDDGGRARHTIPYERSLSVGRHVV